MILMASWKMAGASLIIIVLILLNSSTISKSETKCYESIISFGDSLTDTGNGIVLCLPENPANSAWPPYGRTFFHHPTGRFSDGRLIIDFIAESLNLPLVQPYPGGKNTNGSWWRFRKGINFAVAGAMTLDHLFYEEQGIYNAFTNVSLGTQLNWFKQFLATVPDGRKFLQKSLVLMGEFGGNDYNLAIVQGKTMEEAQSIAHMVVDNIGYTVQELIKLGAESILVPGNFPLGCSIRYLTRFERTSNRKDYDSKTDCLNWLNNFSKYHNKLLQKELNRIQELHPHVTLFYADYYNAAMQFYLSPNEHGFTKGALRACCGVGGSYNYNASAECGTPSVDVTSCDDPSSFANWDGIHFTEAANRLIAQGLLHGPYTRPQFRNICPSLAMPARLINYQPKIV